MSQMCPNCSQDNLDYAPTCTASGEPLRGLLGQNTLLEGRYRLTRVLGCGGMGAVYLADDNRIAGRQVAVKENLGTSLQAQAQFQSEISLMVGLNHPGLPKVSDQFISPTGRQYMVMDYVPGETLEEMVARRGPLPEAEAVALAEQVLSVLEYLHSHSVIHRDVKPANIKLTPEGKPVLVDFGIAKLHAPGRRTQTAARGFGSPGFAPIEQYGSGTDARSDLYSLGAVLYYLVTGQAPPEAPDIVPGEPLTPPRQVRPDLAPYLQGAIFKAMALDPAQRYQSAAEMRQALLGHQPAAPRLWLIGGAVGLVIVGVIGGVLLAGGLRPAAPPIDRLTSTRAATRTPVSLAPTPIDTPAPMPAPTNTPAPTATHTPLPSIDTPTLVPTPTTVPSMTPTQTPGFHTVSLASIANASTEDGYVSPPSGQVKLGGVLFDLPSGRNSVTTQANPMSDFPDALWLDVRITSPKRIYLLLTGGDVYTRFSNKPVGSIRLHFDQGAPFSVRLIVGHNIREWKVLDEKTVSTTSSPQVQEVWQTESRHGGMAIIDLLTVELPDSYDSDSLTAIELIDSSIDTVGEMDPALNLLGITVLAD